jgi:hypothetical protein
VTNTICCGSTFGNPRFSRDAIAEFGLSRTGLTPRRANYDTTSESTAAYGKPSFNNNVAYQPRIVQLGFRIAF